MLVIRGGVHPVLVLCVAVSATGCSLAYSFDPTNETGQDLCANGLDDDLDGTVDCGDPDCFGTCPEHSPSTCSNGQDDDGDGAVDEDDTGCLPHIPVHTGIGATEERCSTAMGTRSELAVDAEPWRWLPCGDECAAGHPFVDAPEGPVALLEGPEECQGSRILGESCPQGIAPRATMGGPCFELGVELQLADGAELVVVLGPALDAPLLAVGDAVRLSAARTTEGLLVSYGDAEGLEERTLPSSDGVLSLVARSRSLESETPLDCDGERHGELVIALSTDEGSDTLAAGHALPSSWAPNEPLTLGVATAAPGEARVLALSLEREDWSPCGYFVPQLPVPTASGSVVLGAARGAERICVVGALTPDVEEAPVYDPDIHQNSPPIPAELPSRRFASWHVADRGVESFMGAEVSGPHHVDALDGSRLVSGELAFDAGLFRGVFRVEGPDGDGLVRATSNDCERWAVEPIDVGVADAHPLRLVAEGARESLWVAVPGDGYRFDPAPVRCGASDRTPDGFAAGPHRVPRIGPARSQCISYYPRAELFEVSGLPTMPSPIPVGTVPAHPPWQLECQCAAITDPANDSHRPGEVTQAFGDGKAFVVSGFDGIELVIDDDPEVEAEGDATTVRPTLREASGEPGTFDEVKVSDGHLLDLGRRGRFCPRLGLLFHRGFTRVVEEGGLVRSFGGRSGVIPVRWGGLDTSHPPDGSVPESCFEGE